MRPPSVPTTIPINGDDSGQIVTMKTLYNTLIDHREAKTHRILIQLFMCLPSRKDFPSYYGIIERPIAMNRIRDRIEQSQYHNVDACIDDFKLMFRNCKFFNEDNSQIYRDAVTLENILMKKKEQLLSAELGNNNNNCNNSNNSSSTNGSKTSFTNSNHNETTNNLRNNHQASGKNSHLHGSNKTIITQDEYSNSSDTKSSATSIKTSNNIMPPATSIPSTTNNGNNNDIKSSSTNNDKSNHNSTTSNHRNSINDHDHSNSNEQNGNEDSQQSESLKLNHNHHNDTSMDSSSNLSADSLTSTPVEKCSLNTRRGRNSDAPKRQLLTGYIIYASEIRKQVIDKNPNQNFGDISRLVGNEWKALPHDIRSKYDQRALIHNKRVREKAQRDLNSSGLSNGLHTPKLTKRKLAKLAKEQMKQHHLSIASHDESSIQSPRIHNEQLTQTASQATNSTCRNLQQQRSQSHAHLYAASSKLTTLDSSTQTTAIRFVEPPTKKRLVYSESFKRYIEGLQVPNRDILVEETTPDRPPELPSHWLGGGIGRHESPEAALWALRDFMLQDAATMRKSMEPYL